MDSLSVCEHVQVGWMSVGESVQRIGKTVFKHALFCVTAQFTATRQFVTRARTKKFCRSTALDSSPLLYHYTIVTLLFQHSKL